MSVIFDVKDHIGLVKIDNPSRRNALSTSVVKGILSALDSGQSEVRAFVFSSSCSMFSAGADLKEMLELGWLGSGECNEPTPLDVFERLEGDGRPMIAAIDGLALGGGVELVISCDLAIASKKASFGLPEINHGALPNTAVARLPELIGSRRALDLILTRRRIGADEALSMGLLNAIHPSEELLDRAISLAKSIIMAPPEIISLVKRRLAREIPWPDIREMLREQDQSEYEEGLAAFVEKRPANYEKLWHKGG